MPDASPPRAASTSPAHGADRPSSGPPSTSSSVAARPASAAPAGARSERPGATRSSGQRRGLAVCLGLLLVALASLSVFVGVSEVTPAALWTQGRDGQAALVLLTTRVPRTLALVLVGAALAIAGLIMQMLVRNRFVEPSTTGVTEFAALGLLLSLAIAPGLPVAARTGIAAVFGLAGTFLFLRIVRAVPSRQLVLVPLVGIMLSGVVGAVTTFIALRLDLLQSLQQWAQGSFATVMAGRYEYLWLAAAMAALAWVAADRFSVIGLGEEFATNLGLDYRRVQATGMLIVAVITACVLVTAGTVPFLGLVVPNVVSLLMGDHVRRSIPWVAALGAAFLLACDLVARTVRFPYEIPLSVVVGLIGAVLFLWLLLRRGARAH